MCKNVLFCPSFPVYVLLLSKILVIMKRTILSVKTYINLILGVFVP